MNRADYSFDMAINKAGTYYKNFYVPVTANDLIFSDILGASIISDITGNTNYTTSATTFSVTATVVIASTSSVVGTLSITNLPTLHPKS
jgi:hypothetical protein